MSFLLLQLYFCMDMIVLLEATRPVYTDNIPYAR